MIFLLSKKVPFHYCFQLAINKMYGVDESLMQRIQRRMKEKIYRQMLEEQQKAKQKNKQNKSHKDFAQSRFKTSRSYNDSQHQPNRYESKNDDSHFVNQSSTFLPVINKRQNFQSDRQAGNKINPEYQKYMSRRQKRKNKQQKPGQRIFSSSNGAIQNEKPFNSKTEDSEQQKTQQYLRQCQQIICNLRELTKKNKEKTSQRQNRSKYQAQMHYSPRNKSFREGGMSQQMPISKPYAYTPMAKSSLSNPMQSSIFNNNSWQSNSRPNSYSFGNNQFSERSSFQFQRQRANSKRLSPPRIKIQDLKKKSKKDKKYQQSQQQEEKQQNSESQPQTKGKNSKGKPSNGKNSNGTQDSNGKINLRRLSPLRKKKQQEQDEKQEEQDNEKKQKKNMIEELMKQNQRQKAIVKYLKKARLRGNQLKKKVQSKKGEGDQNGDEKGNQDRNSDPNDPNKPKDQNNPNDPNKANDPNKPIDPNKSADSNIKPAGNVNAAVSKNTGRIS